MRSAAEGRPDGSMPFDRIGAVGGDHSGRFGMAHPQMAHLYNGALPARLMSAGGDASSHGIDPKDAGRPPQSGQQQSGWGNAILPWDHMRDGASMPPYMHMPPPLPPHQQFHYPYADHGQPYGGESGPSPYPPRQMYMNPYYPNMHDSGLPHQGAHPPPPPFQQHQMVGRPGHVQQNLLWQQQQQQQQHQQPQQHGYAPAPMSSSYEDHCKAQQPTLGSPLGSGDQMPSAAPDDPKGELQHLPGSTSHDTDPNM